MTDGRELAAKRSPRPRRSSPSYARRTWSIRRNPHGRLYSGGAVLKRPDMTVTAKQIRAFLKDADEDSSLDKAFADGTVKIVSTSEKLKRTRTGTSEHAEYYADERKSDPQGRRAVAGG